MVDPTGRFSYPRRNLIVSRDGFSVEIRGHDSLWFMEADRKVELFAEQLVEDEPTIVVRKSDVRIWHSPRGQSEVTESERSRILASIRDAFTWKGWRLLVEE